jgi:hypothetical protein
MQTVSSNNDDNNMFDWLVILAIVITLGLHYLHAKTDLPYWVVWTPVALLLAILLFVLVAANYAQLYIKIRNFFRKLNGRH